MKHFSLTLVPLGAALLTAVFGSASIKSTAQMHSTDCSARQKGMNELNLPTSYSIPVHRIPQAKNLSDKPLLYGVTSDLAPDGNGVGIFSFQAAEGMEFLREVSNPDFGGTATYHDGKLYVIHSWRQKDVTNENWTYTNVDIFDVASGEKLKHLVAADHQPGLEYYMRMVAAVDPATGKLYSVTWGDGKPLVTIDTETGEMTFIGKTDKFIQSMMFNDKGTLYGIAYNDGVLYTIDKETAEATEIAKIDVSFPLRPEAQSMTYDPAAGIAYWTTQEWSKSRAAIYTLDLKSAHAELIADFPSYGHFSGLFMPQSPADAPAAPGGMTYDGETLQVSLPSKTYLSDKPLSGDLKVNVRTQEGVTREMTVGANETTASVPMTLGAGKQYIKVWLSNDAGSSPERRLDIFLGEDVPVAVTDLHLELGADKTLGLSWKAPEKSVNGGEIDPRDINYTVIRWPDGTEVASNITETSFSEPVPERHARYSYQVVAYAGLQKGESAMSNIVTAGEFWIPPYTETFDTYDDFASFKVEDANKDGQTWIYQSSYGDKSGYANLNGNGVASNETGYVPIGNDDYLISPLTRLKADRNYRMSVDTYDNWRISEYITVLIGTSRVRRGNEIEIFSTEDMRGNSTETFLFTVPEDGDYAFFFHGNCPDSSLGFALDNITIEEYAVFDAPAMVADLTAQTADKGEMSATIKFTTPDKTYNGAQLDNLSEIRIFRNNTTEPCKIFTAPGMNEKLEWTDTDMSAGMNKYVVAAYNSNGRGESATLSVWVGHDMPSDVKSMTLSRNAEGKPVASFLPPEGRGKHDGYCDNADLSYSLYRYVSYDFVNPWKRVNATFLNNTLTDEEYVNNGSQQYIKYMVVASNKIGSSNGVADGIVLGDSYETPYFESFANANVSKDPWTLLADSYKSAWETITAEGMHVKPYDGDNGYIRFSLVDETANDQMLTTPRFNIGGKTTDELSFYMWHGFEAEPEDLYLMVYFNYDDKGWTMSDRVDYNNGSTGWTRYSIQLDDNAKDVQIGFRAFAADASAAIFIDALSIAPGKAKDVAVAAATLSAKRVEPGDPVNVRVYAANYGTETARDLSVRLILEDNALLSENLTKLEPNEVHPVDFKITTDRTMASKTYSLVPEIEFTGDSDKSNNTGSPIAFHVKGSRLPAPTGLTASGTAGDLTLTWQKPENDFIRDEVTDDFEDYESFIIDNIGDWMTYDGDGTPTTYFMAPEIPHVFDPKAWQVWAPEEAGYSLENFSVLIPKSGNKYLACWAASDGVSKTVPNDDWLISSEVESGSDISFWYKMPNVGSDPQLFEILYSVDSREPEDFIAFDSDGIYFGTDWNYFEYTLPDDARYFAIRSCSEGSYLVAFLDDLRYTPLYGSVKNLKFEGFNVYRDHQLIATGLTQPTYADKPDDNAKHLYHVTASWSEGESNFSNGVSNDLTGVTDIQDYGTIVVEALDRSIRITGAEGLDLDIFTPDGIRLASKIGTGNDLFRVDPGLYIVKAGNVRSYKLRVK